MELISHYLEMVQEIKGVWILQEHEDNKIPLTTESINQLYQFWEKEHPDKPLVYLPSGFTLGARNFYSFYVAMMLLRMGKKVARIKWSKQRYGSVKDIPYLYMKKIDGVDAIIKCFPNTSEEDEFYTIIRDDMDGEDYRLVE